MARPKNVNPAVTSEELSPMQTTNLQASELTHQAFSIFEGEDGWYVAQMSYDPKTGAVGKFEKKLAGPSKDFAVEQMKIDVAYSLL